MSGLKSRRKGAIGERAIKRFLQDAGFACEKTSAMYKPGPDLSVPILGRDRDVEVKVRSGGFKELYKWLIERDILIIRADRQKPLVVLSLEFAAEIAAKAEGNR
jgi:hypothetical protein